MVYYIFIYVASISVSLSGWFVVWRRLKNVSWIFFLLFTLFLALSFTFFFLPYIHTFTDEILLLVSRLLFATSIIAFLYFVSCIYFYWDDVCIFDMRIFFIVIASIVLFFLYAWTNWIIYWIDFNAWISSIIYWVLYPLHLVLSFWFILLIMDFSILKIRERKLKISVVSLIKTLSQIDYRWISFLAKETTWNMYWDYRDSKNSIERQNDFIWVISHEIKSPILAAIFQSEEILDALSLKKSSHHKIKEGVQDLNAQLIRTWDLLSKLFSIQYYDRDDVKLEKESVSFTDFITDELRLFSRIHKHVIIRSNFDKDIPSISIDRVQFQQVITNMLNNAIKFTSKKKPTIQITVRKVWKILELIIEDDGDGFVWIKPEEIFDKYSIGTAWWAGLGMWLYLCRRIIHLHSWTIIADTSQKYWGAKFSITLPLEK